MNNSTAATTSTPTALGAPQLPTPTTRSRQAEVLGGTFYTDWDITTFHTISYPGQNQ